MKRSSVELSRLIDDTDPYDDPIENIEEVTIKRPRRSRRLNVEEHVDPTTLPSPTGDDWNEWVSPSHLKNYFVNDGFLDYLKCNPGNNLLNPPRGGVNSHSIRSSDPSDEQQFLFQRGHEFERHVLNLLRAKFGSDVVDIGGDRKTCRDIQKFKDTADAIRRREPIIYSGVLWNHETKTFGVPDLIVRADFLHKICKGDVIDVDCDTTYRIIDIKFQTLGLKADGVHLLNRGLMYAYKAQILVYTEALNKILISLEMSTAHAGYILGRKWKYTSKDETYCGSSCFGRLGKIDYTKGDEFVINRLEKGLEWVRLCRKDSKNWNMESYPLPHDELYPNMCNPYDSPWHHLKETYAKDHEELTLLWMCGVKQREYALKNGKSSISQISSAEEMGFKKAGKISPVLTKMITINKDPTAPVLGPKKITFGRRTWGEGQAVEFYVDFETINDAFAPIQGTKVAKMPRIFMIGVGVYIPGTDQWSYTPFTVDQITFDEERRICAQFVDFVQTVSERFGAERTVLYHWAPAEPSTFGDFVDRNGSEIDYIRDTLVSSGLSPVAKAIDRDDFIWYDLMSIFKSNPVIVKGVYGFGLKGIAKKFKECGYIDTVWGDDDSCKSGLDAMIQASRADAEAKRLGVSMASLPVTKSIEHYNEVDCKVLMEILRHIRQNH